MTTQTTGQSFGFDVPGPALAHLSTMPRIDLMPPEIAQRTALRKLQAGCLAAVVISAAVIGGLYYQAHGSIGSAQTKLDAAETEQGHVQRQVTALSPVTAAYTSVQQAQNLVTEALGGEVRWSTQLRDLSLSIPDNVWISNMTIARTAGAAAPAAGALATPGIATISFTGVALKRDDVATWLESLAKEKGYVNAYYSTAQEAVLGQKALVNFTSTVTVTDAALSGRYTTPNGG
jgi:Tfp pilus assembly protein PilN